MPTGGAALSRVGENLVKLARKEQCLALTNQLKSKFKIESVFYRYVRKAEPENLATIRVETQLLLGYSLFCLFL